MNNGIEKNPIVPIATIVMYVAGFPTGSCAGGTKESINANAAARIPIVAKKYNAGALYGRSSSGCFFLKTIAARYINIYISI